MKYIFALLVSLFVFSANAEEPASTEQAALESKLSSVELRTAKFISGKEKMANGFANLAPNLRKIACGAYPVASDKDIISDLKKEIEFLEKKKNISQLSAEQATRLSTQKDLISKLTPGIDCAALK